MTGEEFTARYRLTKQLAEGEIVSYSATNARRETLQVHVFRGDEAPEFDSAELDPEAAGLVREVLDVEGLQVVVTEVIEPFSDLASWMEANQRGSGEESGAYTRIFGAIKLPEEGDGSGGADEPEEPAAPGMPSPPEPEPEPEPEPTTEVEPDGPGEYTRIFGAPRVPEPKPSEPANAPEPPPPPPPAPPEPPKAKPPAPPPPRAPDEPGPYTLVMGRPQVNPPSSEPRAPRAPDPPARQESSTSPEDYLVSDTYLDRLREGGDVAGEGDTGASSGAPPPIPPPPSASPRTSGPRVPSGPSEYTRIIRGGSLPGSVGGRGGAPSAGPPPPAPTPSKPPARASRTPLIVGLVVTAAVLIALVLFVLMRP